MLVNAAVKILLHIHSLEFSRPFYYHALVTAASYISQFYAWWCWHITFINNEQNTQQKLSLRIIRNYRTFPLFLSHISTLYLKWHHFVVRYFSSPTIDLKLHALFFIYRVKRGKCGLIFSILKTNNYFYTIIGLN